MKDKAIFKLDADCGRQGSLEGIFISTKEKVKALIDKEVGIYFGEVLGKHSEVCGSLDKEDIVFVTNDPKVIELVEKHGLTSGHNPFHYNSHDFEIDGVNLEDMIVDEVIDILLKKK